jgi:pyruvate/2-oxoglutarate dehydrogenase complex dihydrolipoamide acyltransferase (E2) component
MKKEGDTLAAGETLLEVETDKSTLAFDVQDETVLAKILE